MDEFKELLEEAHDSDYCIEEKVKARTSFEW